VSNSSTVILSLLFYISHQKTELCNK